MIISQSGLSPQLSDADANASVVFQAAGSGTTGRFTAQAGLFSADSQSYCAPSAPGVLQLTVLPTACGPYELKFDGTPGIGGDGQINVGSGPGGDDDDDDDDD
jgi:hypothetical protein